MTYVTDPNLSLDGRAVNGTVVLFFLTFFHNKKKLIQDWNE